MASRKTRTLSFTPEQVSFVADCVQSGRYQSASEVVRAALRLLQEQEALREAELARIRALVREGVDQLERGDMLPADEVFKRLEAKHRRLEKGKKRGK